MAGRELAAFLDAVRREIERRGFSFTIEDGLIRIQRDANGPPADYGLTNLAQLCHQLEPGEWSTAIANHFESLFQSEDEQARLAEVGVDFEAVRSMLKVRLFPAASLGGITPDPLVGWELAPGLVAAFVYDLPSTVATVNREHIEAWGRPREELLTTALANVRDDAVECRPMAGAGPSAPMACVANHFFAASHAFLLDERLPPAAVHGAIFAVPHRHALLYAPIVDLGLVDAINRLIVTTVSMFQQGPGSISPGLYWRRAGAITLLPASFDGRSVSFSPPGEFVAVLNDLPKDPGE